MASERECSFGWDDVIVFIGSTDRWRVYGIDERHYYIENITTGMCDTMCLEQSGVDKNYVKVGTWDDKRKREVVDDGT